MKANKEEVVYLKEYEEYDEINPIKKRAHSNRHTKTPKLKRLNGIKIGAILSTAIVVSAAAIANSPEPLNWTKKEVNSIAEIADRFNKGHDFSEWAIVLEADCNNNGTRQRVCTTCNEIEVQDIPAAHHEVVLSKVEPTCKEEGLSEGLMCDVCGQIFTSQTAIPKIDHAYNQGKIEKAPTCIEKGTKVFTCKYCDETKTETIAPTGNHTIAVIPETPASCTSSGLTQGQRCSVCNEVLVSQTEIPAIGHHIVPLAAVNSTCSKPGHGEGTYCDVCGTIINPGVEYGTIEHEYNWDAPERVEPTCTSEGSETYICIYCGDRVSEMLDPFGHNDYDGDMFCDICGAEMH